MRALSLPPRARLSDLKAVFDPDSGKLLFRRTVPDDDDGTAINHCAVHPDGQLILAAGDLPELFLLRIQEGGLAVIQRLPGALGSLHVRRASRRTPFVRSPLRRCVRGALTDALARVLRTATSR